MFISLYKLLAFYLKCRGKLLVSNKLQSVFAF